MISPLIRDRHWERIRDSFTEEEKALLREATTGQVICPRGVTVDFNKLTPILRQKLEEGIKRASAYDGDSR